MAHDHEERARPIAQGGSRIVRWETNLNLGSTHHGFRLKLARRSRAAEDEPQQAADPPVYRRLIMEQVQGRQRQLCVTRHDGATHVSREIHFFCAGRCWLSPSPNVLLVQCTFYLMNDILRKSRKREPRRPGLEWLYRAHLLMPGTCNGPKFE